MTPQEASKVVAMLMAAYPNARVPDGTVALYETLLLEFDRDRTSKAVRAIIMSSKFMPTIAEIVTAYEGEKSTEEIPYHRQFKPVRHPGVMSPAELKAELDAYLAKDAKPLEPEAPAEEKAS